jgi:hypothetical protein
LLIQTTGLCRTGDGAWVTQQARQISWPLAERPEPIRLLIRDHDRKFTRCFDEVFQAAGIGIVRTPIHAPQAKGEDSYCTSYVA